MEGRILAYFSFTKQFQHLPGGTEGNQGNDQSMYSISGPSWSLEPSE